jgi:hypothetical protein
MRKKYYRHSLDLLINLALIRQFYSTRRGCRSKSVCSRHTYITFILEFVTFEELISLSSDSSSCSIKLVTVYISRTRLHIKNANPNACDPIQDLIRLTASCGPTSNLHRDL